MLLSNSFKYFLIATVLVLSSNRAYSATTIGNCDSNYPPDSKIYANLEYAHIGDAPLLLDLYIPKSANAPIPLIVWVHGGGWQNRSKEESVLPIQLGFLNKGYAIASIDYRLTDKAIFPAQIYDCKAAVRFLRGNAQKYGLAPNRFGAWGQSAGGHLVALLGVTSNSNILDGNEGHYLNESASVQAVCDFCGPTDLATIATPAENPEFARADSPVSKLLGGPVLENLDKAVKASPLTYVTKNTPPFLIAHGDKDTIVPPSQSIKFCDALKKVNVPVKLNILSDTEHSGPAFYEPNFISNIEAFFNKNLGRK